LKGLSHVRAFTSADDYFHDLEDPMFRGWDRSGWFNESSFFGFSIPEREINGEMYVHHRVNRETMWAGTLLWDASGHRAHDCLRWDWSLWPRPEGSQLLDFRLPNSLTFRTLEPLRHFTFSYHADGYEAELQWVAITGPQGHIPESWGNWSACHFDQFGRMSGEIVLEGERIAVDCLSCRDRSFGPHRAGSMPRVSYSFAVADENSGFMIYTTSKHAPADDPWFGTVEPVVGGWVLKDGTTEPVTGGERRLERFDDTRPQREVILFEDRRGRQYEANGEVRNHLFFDGYPGTHFWWCMTKWEYDGKVCWGETQDGGSIEGWRRLFRRRLQAAAEAA
jgi:hypothetical protein